MDEEQIVFSHCPTSIWVCSRHKVPKEKQPALQTLFSFRRYFCTHLFQLYPIWEFNRDLSSDEETSAQGSSSPVLKVTTWQVGLGVSGAIKASHMIRQMEKGKQEWGTKHEWRRTGEGERSLHSNKQLESIHRVLSPFSKDNPLSLT